MQLQASERFHLDVLAKKLGGEKAYGSTGFVITNSLHNTIILLFLQTRNPKEGG